MPIIDFSDGDKDAYRATMLDTVRRSKAQDSGFSVVDIGGRHNPWADDLVDAYVDFFDFETDKQLYVGDVNDEAIWRTLEREGPFDFAICSHVLEDIRDPIVGLTWLPRIAKAGFIGLPVKHREFANSKSSYWLGQPQHYWIYSVKRDEAGEPYLLTMPKWHSIHYFNQNTPDYPPLGEEDADLGPRTLDWFDEAKSGYGLELGIIWQGSIPFRLPEYTLIVSEQIEMYRTMLADGV